MPIERSAEMVGSFVDRNHLDMSKISDFVFDRCDQLGYEKLDRPEQVFLCVWALEGEVNNGGFDQFYFNSSGDHATEVVGALEVISAIHTANLVRKANALFGKNGPSSDRITRQRQLNSLGDISKNKMTEMDKDFYECRDNLGRLLEDYVSRNSKAFRPK